MKIKLEKKEKNKAYLNFEIDEKQFDKALDQSYKKNTKRFTVPGFRRGRAPRKLIELHYGPEVFYEDAAQLLLPEAYQKGVEEYELEPVDQPKFDIQQIEKGKPFIASAEVLVKPEVKIGKYKGLEVEKFVYNVTDEDVEKELSAMQEKNARLVEVKDRPAKKSDVAIIDFEGTIDGEPFEGNSGENFSLELGSNTFTEGFEDQIVGMCLGDNKDISVTFPDDYSVKALSGKNAVFNVTLKELKTKELLPLDDDFVKDISEFDTLDELKADIRSKMEREAEAIQTGSLKSSIVDKLLETVEIDIPQVMIDQETDRIMFQYALQLRYSGYDLNTYLKTIGKTTEEFKEGFKDKAIENLKSSLIIEEIGKKEGITVTDEELENKIEELAKDYKKEVEDFKKGLNPGDTDGIKNSVLTQKIFDFLIEHSNIIEKKEADVEEKKEVNSNASDEETL